MTILVTGGAGFIGSHTCAELLARGYDVVVVDDYSNSSPAALDAVQRLTSRQLTTYTLDIREPSALSAVFERHTFDAVVHFAAKKAVAESMSIPLDYFAINIVGTINLLRAMTRYGVHQLVFSSSCSIYGDLYSRPIAENDAPAPTNPYARTKLVCEQMLADACRRYPDLSVIALRYFNPVGGHPSGELGEDPQGVPNNIMPYMMQVALGRLDALIVFGNDYDTPDGTGVRDYIHVMDVAEAHCVAVERLSDHRGMRSLNLGTGCGVSVLELRAAFEEACQIPIPYQIAERRPGDVGMLIADPSLADKEWGWRTSRALSAMCADAWRFAEHHPNGYRR